MALLDIANRVLPREDSDASEVIRPALERDGVKLYVDTRIQSVRKEGSDRIFSIEGQVKKMELAVGHILVAAGRRPNVESLDLEKADIAYDQIAYDQNEGVTVNDHLRTSNPDVYAAGDICSPYKFTHAADAMARIVIANALFKAHQKMSALVIPWCTLYRFRGGACRHVRNRSEGEGH